MMSVEPKNSTIICDECGRAYDGSLPACPHCGHPTAGSSAPAAAEQAEAGSRPEDGSSGFCTHCGAPRKADELYCGRCGRPFDGSARKEPKRSRGCMKVFLGAFLALLVLALVFFLVKFHTPRGFSDWRLARSLQGVWKTDSALNDGGIYKNATYYYEFTSTSDVGNGGRLLTRVICLVNGETNDDDSYSGYIVSERTGKWRIHDGRLIIQDDPSTLNVGPARFEYGIIRPSEVQLLVDDRRNDERRKLQIGLRAGSVQMTELEVSERILRFVDENGRKQTLIKSSPEDMRNISIEDNSRALSRERELIEERRDRDEQLRRDSIRMEEFKDSLRAVRLQKQKEQADDDGEKSDTDAEDSR